MPTNILVPTDAKGATHGSVADKVCHDADRTGITATQVARSMSLTAIPRSLLAGLALAGLAVTTATAGTCLDDVRAMAAKRGIAIDPPNAPREETGTGVTSKALGRTGGVIEPPRVNDPAVIEPPGGVRYGMPTMPEVDGNTPRGRAVSPPSPQKQALLESILIAARAEALQGDEDGCFMQFRKAQDLIGE